MEEKNGSGVHTISLARVAFWLTMIPATMVWFKTAQMGNPSGSVERDIGSSHLSVLLSLMAYNFGKHVVNGMVAYSGGWPVNGTNSQPLVQTTQITQPTQPIHNIADENDA